MNRILLICLLVATVAFGQETNLSLTVDGVTYQNVRFQRVTPLAVTIFHSTGVATIPMEKLPAETQKQLGYSPEQAQHWKAAQQEAATETAEARKKTAATVGWNVTIESILTNGILAKGCRSDEDCLHPVPIFLVEHPQIRQLAEGNGITVTAYKDGVVMIDGHSLEKWVYFQPVMTTRAAPKVSVPSVINVNKSGDDRDPTPTILDVYVSDPRLTGAFGFPEQQATILCNRFDLRFSVWSNREYLFAQATLWKDDDPSVGKDADGAALGDYSYLMLDLDNDKKETPDLDRVYYLNQRPSAPGLCYAIWKKNGAQTLPQYDSEARGAIRYVITSYRKRVRVDTYLIPLSEISKKVGDKIGICFYGASPKPLISVNSVTREVYQPTGRYQGYVLADGGPIDVSKVPDGRNDLVDGSSPR